LAPKLSVITPSYNQGRFLERTIRSVLDQGYENLEYVIVDGGSTDESVEVIERYADRLAWWVSEPDEGQTDAINKGIERTSGDVVAYVNSDDYYLPSAFDTAIAALEAGPERWVGGAAIDVDENDGPLDVGRPSPEPGLYLAEPPEAWDRMIKGRHWWMLHPWSIAQPSTFWRRELFDEFGLFRTDMHFAFDAEFMLRLVYAGERPKLLDAKLSARVTHPGQKSADMSQWEPERRKMIEIFKPELTAGERRRLAAVRALRAVGFYELRPRVWNPVLRKGGDLLEHVPERFRPAIRDRDRERQPPGS
jgi:glycosyltransferase involved in cell wall biosynthesis